LARVLNKDVELTPAPFLSTINGRVEEIIERSGVKIAGIGISSPGLQMDNGHGTLSSVNMPFLNGFDLKNYFESRYNLPVVVSNDLVAHSMADQKFGVGNGVDRFLSVSLGTGIGHAFFNHGVPIIITNGISGDSGRMILDPNSDIHDSGGIFGSAEALCGVRSIEILARKIFHDGVNYSAEDIIRKAREEADPDARRIMTIISQRLALLLVNLSAIYFPEVISITGGQTEAGEFFINECQNEFNLLSHNFYNDIARIIGKEEKVRIVKSNAGGLAGLVGCIVPLIL
jgi:glucokinase